jgi:transposase InsO family protein
MRQYNSTKGFKGIRSLLKQFNESVLTPWQRDLLRERLLILSWYDRNSRNKTATAREFETSRSYVHKLVKAGEEEVLQTDIKAVLTDNGSEFLAHFHKACLKQEIEHFFTRPRTPKDNAIAERFNLTLQQHLYWRIDLTKPIYKINKVLADWLIEYNCLRPHESLNMRPPAAHYFHLFYSPRKQGVYLKLWNRTAI